MSFASPTPPALHAMRSLADMVRGVRSDALVGHADWLQLMVRLRAASDTLVSREGASSRDKVRLGCQAFLELVVQAADASASTLGPDALDKLLRRSDHYVKQVEDSARHLVGHGSELLAARLAQGQRNGLGRGSSGLGRSMGVVATGGSFNGSARNASASTAGAGASSDAAAEASSWVLTYGFCPYVTALLLRASRHAHFTLLIAESRPDGPGHRTAEALLDEGVPVLMIEFASVARYMGQVELVIVGADAVLADGGVLAPVGTLTTALAAHAHGRPFYVAAPHHVFCHTHHLDAAAQTATRGVPTERHRLIMREQPTQDATPPHLVTLLVTDVGVLTPSAVADEMMQRRLR